MPDFFGNPLPGEGFNTGVPSLNFGGQQQVPNTNQLQQQLQFQPLQQSQANPFTQTVQQGGFGGAVNLNNTQGGFGSAFNTTQQSATPFGSTESMISGAQPQSQGFLSGVSNTDLLNFGGNLLGAGLGAYYQNEALGLQEDQLGLQRDQLQFKQDQYNNRVAAGNASVAASENRGV